MIEEHDHEYRIGIGTDIHKLVEGRKLMLGGVFIKFPKGLLGHSDGDVALHALIDAMFGAAGMGDIGTHFPDTDEKYKNGDSKALIIEAREKIEKERWVVVNVDLIIHLEQPRLEQFKGQIKRAVAGLLSVDFNAVNIKAKTNEGLGEIGAGEAIAATAAILIKRKYKRTL